MHAQAARARISHKHLNARQDGLLPGSRQVATLGWQRGRMRAIV